MEATFVHNSYAIIGVDTGGVPSMERRIKRTEESPFKGENNASALVCNVLS